MSLWKAVPVLTCLGMAGYYIDVQRHRLQNWEVHGVSEMAIQLLEALKKFRFVVNRVGIERHIELFQR